MSADDLGTRMVANALWSLVGAAFSRLLTVAAGIVAARWLGAETFGRLGIVQSSVALFGVFAGLGFGLASTKLIAQSRTLRPETAGSYARAALAITGVGCAVVAAPFVLIAPWLASAVYEANDIVTPLRLGVALLAFSVIGGTQQGVLAGYEAFKAIAICSVVHGVAAGVGLVLGAHSAGLSGAVLGLAAGEAVRVVVTGWAITRTLHATGVPAYGAFDRHHLRSMLALSLPALVSSIGHLPAAWFASALVVRQEGGLAQMGIYTAASRWYLAVLFIPSAVSQIVLPMLVNLRSTGSTTAYQRVFRTNLTLNLVVTAVPATVLVLSAPTIMRAYGGEYEAGEIVLVLLALATIPTAVNNVLGQVIVSSRSMWWRVAFDLLLGVTLLGTSAMLVQPLGARGLAGAYLTSFAVVALGMWYFFSRTGEADK